MMTHRTNFKYKTYLREFSENTSLHGIRFVGEQRRHPCERLFWLFAMAVCAVLCGLEIMKVWNRWNVSPVIISFSQRPTRVHEIEFPAVTVCPGLQLPRDTLDLDSITELAVDQWGYEARQFLTNLTDEQQLNAETSTLLCENTPLITFSPNKTHLDNMIKLSPKFNEIAHDCFYTSYPRHWSPECKHLFTPLITDLGVCFSFNMQKDQQVFRALRDEQSDFDRSFIRHANPSVGPNSGLRLVLKIPTDQQQGLCSPILENTNFKIFIHSPADFPSSRGGIQILTLSPWTQVEVRLHASLTTTAPELKKYSPDVRGCLFQDDLSLSIFQTYTSNHCELECDAISTEEQCLCRLFYLPLTGDSKIHHCNKQLRQCNDIVRKPSVDPQVADKPREMTSSLCKYCLPNCTELKYQQFINNNRLDPKQVHSLEDWDLDTHSYRPANTTGFDFAEISIFFDQREFLSIHRSELFGLTDVLSSCGGLLGLFTGFSVITLIEILHFASLRLFCTLRRQNSAPSAIM